MLNEPRIIIVEDDNRDATWIGDALRAGLNARVEVIACERDFIERLGTLAADKPDLIILDVMLRWATSSEDLEREVEAGKVPEKVIKETFLRAGLRCIERLKESDGTRDIPYVIYTGLQENNFAEEVIHISEVITKTDDIRPLLLAVRNKLDLAPGRKAPRA
jgi:CheY-like chemotaxis protein